MKKTKIVYWVSTTLIFLFEGVLPALTGHSQMAIDGITGLGYPLYFVTILTVFKVIGGLVLIIPKVPARVKEWAYAGYGIDFICAFISIWVVAGLNLLTFFPLLVFAVMIVSYISYHKIKSQTVAIA